MIVDIWMSWVSILEKTPRKTQKNNKLKNTKYQKNQPKGGPVFTFSLPGAARPLALMSVTSVVTGLYHA